MLALQNIMELASMKDAKVLFGYTMGQLTVTGITIMEAPDIANWMSEGQILLCSLYSLPREDASVKTFVLALVKAKIAALFVKPRENVPISPALIQVCMEHQLNLVQIPENMAYSIIMCEVMGQLFDIQLNRASYFKRYHDIFMRVALDGKGVDAIVQTLAQQVNSNLILYNNEQTVLAVGGIGVLNQPVIEPDTDYVRQIFGNISCFEKEILLADRLCKGLSVPIKVLNRIKAYLFVEGYEKREFSEFEWIAIENAITVLKLEITKEIALTEIEQKFKNDLSDDLFSGKSLSDEVIFDRARVIGWDLNRPYRCMIAKIVLKNNNTEENSHIMGELSAFLRQMICEAWKISGKGCIIRILNQSLVALLPMEEGESDDENFTKVQEVGQKLLLKGQAYGAQKQTAAGIGEMAANLHLLHRSYTEAADSLRFGHKIEAQIPIYSFRNLGVYRLICSFEDKKLLKSFIPPYLKKLIDHVQEDTSLLETLDAFLECGCSPQQAAKKLFVHHKTLVYRIAKIKAIMGVDTFDNEKKLEMQIAFKILQLKDNLQ